MVSHFPRANPFLRGRAKRDDSTGATATPTYARGNNRVIRRQVVTACCVVLSMTSGVLVSAGVADARPPVFLHRIDYTARLVVKPE